MMLENLFPIIHISDDERIIFIKEEDKEYHLKTEVVKETWQQNPKCDAEPISLLAQGKGSDRQFTIMLLVSVTMEPR